MLTRKLLNCANRDYGSPLSQHSSHLNDEVCNFTFAMLQQRELTRNPKQPKVYFFNTFFYNKLYANNGKYDFKGVERWGNKLNFSILDCETLVVPIHKNLGHGFDHWVSVVINMKDVFLEFLDSNGGPDDKALVRTNARAGRFLGSTAARSSYRTCGTAGILVSYIAVLGPRPSWASAEAGDWTN
jgi:hypothetical protein